MLAAGFSIALVRADPPRKQIGPLLVLAGLLTLISLLYFVQWTSRKPFLRDLGRIKKGMTETEVRQIMVKYLEGPRFPASPLGGGGNSPTPPLSGEMPIEYSLVFRHSNEAAFDADLGIVAFFEGRVTDSSFLPD